MEKERNKILALRKALAQHNKEYYVYATPTISDFQFDQMMQELIQLEKKYPDMYDENSPTQRVGSDINQSFQQVSHKYPMLSLSNTYSESEVSEFYDRIAKNLTTPFRLVCELKYDGTSISLTYKNGKLQHAITRGDGVKGDDVTANVRTIRTIPLTLQEGENYPEEFEIRGEILMPWHIFEKLNEERTAQNEAPFANPRNAASGTLKIQNSSQVAKRELDAYLYYLLGENLPTDSHFENLQQAKKWGFKISDAIKVCETIDEVLAFLNYWDKERKNLPVATDGVVIKVDSTVQQTLLGNTAKSPRWAIAYKYKAESATTQLQSVSYQVGRTGAITPVANLTPVLLSGTIVKRASLHNADVMEALDLRTNDWVSIEKGGEIIPKITAVDTNLRTSETDEKIQFIDKCPECNTTLIRYEGEAVHYCPNDTHCPPQIKGRIAHFVSRKAMDIDGLGNETINLLFQHKLIENVADIYALEKEDLTHLERLGEKSALNILAGIDNSKKIPFERVLYALGIRFVGDTTAKKLAMTLHHIENLKKATFEELCAIDEIGERIAQSIVEYWHNEENLTMVEKLEKAGLQMAIDEQELLNRTTLLAGKSIVVSGKFSLKSRNEYKKIIEQNGGKNVSGVSSKTDFILAGENMGAEKLKKAEKLNIPILNETEFLKMVEKD